MGLIPNASFNRLLQDLTSAIKNLDGDIIAIDGKTLRGSRGWNNQEDRPLHLLHA